MIRKACYRRDDTVADMGQLLYDSESDRRPRFSSEWEVQFVFPSTFDNQQQPKSLKILKNMEHLRNIYIQRVQCAAPTQNLHQSKGMESFAQKTSLVENSQNSKLTVLRDG